MGYNKFIKKDGKVLLDLTSDTVASDKLMSGVTAHNRSGEAINGTFTIDNELATQDNLIAQIQTALEGKASGEDLDEVISELEEKIDTLNSTLANKAAGGSGGGNLETCTFTITVDSPIPLGEYVYYTNENMELQSTELEFGTNTVTVLKNSILYVTFGVMDHSDNLTRLEQVGVLYISGNAEAYC